MNNNINIAELLKDCPKGMELDCTTWDSIVFEEIDGDNIVIFRKSGGSKVYLTRYGDLNTIDGKCIIFPKGKTTWEGFVPPCKFKDGDIVATNSGMWIGITTGGVEHKCMPTYCVIKSDGKFEAYLEEKAVWGFNRLATEDEKQKLFQAIKDNGYRWNADTKTLEKLVEPKFNRGDIVYTKAGSLAIIGGDVNRSFYPICRLFSGRLLTDFVLAEPERFATEEEKQKLFDAIKENGYRWNAETKTLEKEEKKDKFDITTLRPFESKVLVRNIGAWEPAFWGYYSKEYAYPFVVAGGNTFAQCIPYEHNQHLLGTANDCDEYYKTWKDETDE